MIIAIENVEGIQEAQHAIEQVVHHPIALPQRILAPKHTKLVYAYGEATASRYEIYFDHTRDCHGAKYCNIGSISVSHNGKPAQIINMKGFLITDVVKLANGMKAYYTPAHVMADSWPTHLEWIDKKQLVSFSWNLDSKTEQDDILSMANSMQTS